MYLNSAKVTSWVLNGKDYNGSRKRFMKALCETHNFTVNLVLGNKLLGRGNVSFMENSGWVIAHVDSRFAFDKDEHISGLTISICNNGNEILSSETEVSYFISGSMSTDADLYFMVGSVYAYNDSKEALPESFFRSSNYDRLTKTSYEDLPSPVGPEPSDVLRVITDEFLVTKDGTNTETAYSVLEIPSETVEYLSQSGELETFSAKFMGRHDDPSIWTGIFYANDYMMLYKTGDMPEGSDYSGISLTTVHPSVYDGKDDAANPIKVNVPDAVTIKTYINGIENSDSAYWPYTTSDNEYTVVVPAHKEDEEPSDVVKIISDTFEVSNDVSVSGDTVTYNNRKTAYSVLEISKSDWQDLLDNNSNADSISFAVSYNDMEGWKADISAWVGQFVVGELFSEPGPVITGYLSAGFPESDSGTFGGDDYPKCSFTTASISLIRLDMGSGEYTKLYSARAKTYIDGVENTDTTYVPCFDSDYPFAQETCTIEGADPVTNEWLWESGDIPTEYGGLTVHYRLAVRDVADEYRDAILNTTFTGTNIYSTDNTCNIYVKSVTDENIVGTLFESNSNYPLKGSIKLYDASVSTSQPIATLFAQMFKLVEDNWVELDTGYNFNKNITLTLSKIEE